MKKLLVLTLVAVLAVGCSARKHQKSQGGAAQETAVQDIHNARNSLDYVGTYEGTFPAANAPGMEVVLTLNADGTYVLHGHYIDRPAAGDLHSSGTYSWDDAGNNITLSGLKNDIGRYKVEENRLKMVDMLYEEITGEMAAMYILKKKAGK